jgi:6-phosphogluconolactonase
MSIELRVVDDPTRACVELVQPALQAGPVVLTGGSTVKAYSQIDPAAWRGAKVWLSDERHVPFDDDRSNYGSILSGVGEPIRQAELEPVPTDRQLDQAAEAYEQALSEKLGAGGFELMLLGLGPDGHICSMFPGQTSLDERRRLVVGVPEAGLEPFVARITLTFPAITLAKRVVVMATGAAKADAVSAAFAEDAPVSREVPASLLSEFAQELTVILDDASAARL